MDNRSGEVAQTSAARDAARIHPIEIEITSESREKCQVAFERMADQGVFSELRGTNPVLRGPKWKIIATGFFALALIVFSTDVQASPLNWAEIYASRPAAPRVAPLPIPRGDVASRVADAARLHGVPVRLALGVAMVESGMRCSAIGAAGERGVLQIKPATARGLGYRGSVAALNTCGAGLEWGMRHLSVAYRRCGTEAGAKRLHNRGLAASCIGATAYAQRVRVAMRRL